MPNSITGWPWLDALALGQETTRNQNINFVGHASYAQHTRYKRGMNFESTHSHHRRTQERRTTTSCCPRRRPLPMIATVHDLRQLLQKPMPTIHQHDMPERQCNQADCRGYRYRHCIQRAIQSVAVAKNDAQQHARHRQIQHCRRPVFAG